MLGAWGVKGGLKVKAFSSDPQALFSSKRWWVEPPDAPAAPPGAARAAALPRLLRIVQAREQGDAIVATSQELTPSQCAQFLTYRSIHFSNRRNSHSAQLFAKRRYTWQASAPLSTLPLSHSSFISALRCADGHGFTIRPTSRTITFNWAVRTPYVSTSC